MTEFKDKIRAAGGKVEFFYRTDGGIDTQISGSSASGFRAMYVVAVSMDGRRLLATVPVTGIGRMPVYPQPSVLTYIQSDDQGMWGRNCPMCHKYFRTTHITDVTWCPYCAAAAPSLDFVSRNQWTYITACYDAFARAYMGRKDTCVETAAITDGTSAWHYSEEKQQTHFKCDGKDCGTEADILGEYGYCPRCGGTNARKLFNDKTATMLARWDTTNTNIRDKKARGEVWEDLTTKCVSEFEALGKHLRRKLLCHPMTPNRRKQLEAVSFQNPLRASDQLKQWFDISILEWPGNDLIPHRVTPEAERPFITKMVQRRHILTHNGGVVDQEYLDISGDKDVSLGERIRVRSNEAKRFLEDVSQMATNLLDNIENGFEER